VKISTIAKCGLGTALLTYIGVCFGKIAGKHGKNPTLYGILSLVSPVNLIILGYWAFSDYEKRRYNGMIM
jgi:high-affinity Fe2+/Pb2+ permease